MGDIPKKEWKEAYLISTKQISILKTRLTDVESQNKKLVELLKRAGNVMATTLYQNASDRQDSDIIRYDIDELLKKEA